MATERARGLHALAFRPKVRFIRSSSDGRPVAECVVCGEFIAAETPEAFEPELEQHRGLAHVVRVYAHGIEPPAPKPRRAKLRPEAPPC